MGPATPYPGSNLRYRCVAGCSIADIENFVNKLYKDCRQRCSKVEHIKFFIFLALGSLRLSYQTEPK